MEFYYKAIWFINNKRFSIIKKTLVYLLYSMKIQIFFFYNFV